MTRITFGIKPGGEAISPGGGGITSEGWGGGNCDGQGLF